MRKGKKSSESAVHDLRKRTGTRLVIVNHQQGVSVDMPLLRRMGLLALSHCSDNTGGHGSTLSNLPVVEVAIVSDAVILEVHRQFFREDSPTDVVTFSYGEVVISAETAAFNSGFYGHSPTVEIAFCLIHGLLHLNGYSDYTILQATKMMRRQTRILTRVYQELWPG
ncbi:MAG: rRNA maturation RNase YbeY [Candidatus Xiphinematobacter sp.]|nr:MAG: rRNA maturation RNase YbeY [Candidatus Xiphinematobacter sp.]